MKSQVVQQIGGKRERSHIHSIDMGGCKRRLRLSLNKGIYEGNKKHVRTFEFT